MEAHPIPNYRDEYCTTLLKRKATLEICFLCIIMWTVSSRILLSCAFYHCKMCTKMTDSNFLYPETIHIEIDSTERPPSSLFSLSAVRSSLTMRSHAQYLSWNLRRIELIHWCITLIILKIFKEPLECARYFCEDWIVGSWELFQDNRKKWNGLLGRQV